MQNNLDLINHNLGLAIDINNANDSGLQLKIISIYRLSKPKRIPPKTIYTVKTILNF